MLLMQDPAVPGRKLSMADVWPSPTCAEWTEVLAAALLGQIVLCWF